MVVSGAVTMHVPLRAGNPDCSQVILASSLPTDGKASLFAHLEIFSLLAKVSTEIGEGKKG